MAGRKDGQTANLGLSLPQGLFCIAAQGLHRVTDTSGTEETALATHTCHTSCIGEPEGSGGAVQEDSTAFFPLCSSKLGTE